MQSVVSFYSFLSLEPRGRIVIRLCDDIVDRHAGFDRVARAVCDELGVGIGGTSENRAFSVETTSCIGMCDQAPAALVGDVVVTELSGDRAREMVRELRRHMDPQRLVHRVGDGNNAHPLVNSMVMNNVRQAGPIVLSPIRRGEAIHKAMAISPREVIRAIKTSRLRGRGGAGFPTGIKWGFVRDAAVDHKVVIANADEGEPGTFKDRVILTERPDRIFAGMTIAAYAVGATEGILYLRGEYAYLRPFLEHVLQHRRDDGLLGTAIGGRPDFDFDIRIQLGAGAYVCGEETALINSCEGKRGDPRSRPPFPGQHGYHGHPTIVNNVETFCCVTKVLEEGPATFCEHGIHHSTGTKLLCVSGDCTRPGTYELPFGVPLREVLALAGATNPLAVQVGGPSGRLVGVDELDRTVDFENLATGGAIIVFDRSRDLLEIVDAYANFFVHESCGYCTPCRVGTVLIRDTIDRIRAGRGEAADLEQLQALGRMMKATSRCGLGQTAANPVLSSLKGFRDRYEQLLEPPRDGLRRSFDLSSAVLSNRRDNAKGVF
ncbi:MAG: NADH-ubiquinone oxidoreductase-F iron-sulfur binding region domain-containing protein [Planctomycetota bacterium]